MKGTKREGARFRENRTTCRYDRGSFDIQFISCHVWQSVVTASKGFWKSVPSMRDATWGLCPVQ